MNRRDASQNLAKAIAYVECGKPHVAAEFLTLLLMQFAEEGVSPSRASASLRQPASAPLLDQHDLSAASAWLGGRLLKRDGSVQL